jgi:hypothetical protein
MEAQAEAQTARPSKLSAAIAKMSKVGTKVVLPDPLRGIDAVEDLIKKLGQTEDGVIALILYLAAKDFKGDELKVSRKRDEESEERVELNHAARAPIYKNERLNDLFYDNAEMGTSWILLLSCYHRCKKMTEKNVKSFFQMNGLDFEPSNVLVVLDWASTALGNLEKNRDLLTMARETEFGQQRTAAASISSLATKFITFLEENADKVFSPEELRAVDAANARTYDLSLQKAIPQRVVALTALYHEVAGSKIGEFYAGIRAVNELDAVTRMCWTAGIRAAIDAKRARLGDRDKIKFANPVKLLAQVVDVEEMYREAEGKRMEAAVKEAVADLKIEVAVEKATSVLKADLMVAKHEAKVRVDALKQPSA